MVVRWGGLLILGMILCLIFIGVASASKPDSIDVTSSKSWLVANGMDTATIEVHVKDHGNESKDAEVTFTVNADLGSCSPVTVITGPDGKNSTTFNVNSRPGIATIRATAEGENSTTITKTIDLNILAPYPDEITPPTSSADWLIANGSDHATITVKAFNNSPSSNKYPVPGVHTIFAVNNSIFGTINPGSVTSNTQGIASSTFTTNKKSGVATIYANVSFIFDGVTHTLSLTPLFQKIDHDTPYRISNYNYSTEMEVAELKPAAFTFSDRWGNPVDNRRIAENVSIRITSPSPEYNASISRDNVTFSNNLTIPVDGTGTTPLYVQMNTRPGWNMLIIHPFMYTPTGEQAISDKYLTIEGVPSKPARIEANFNPSNFMVPADGSSKFDIRYTMWDKWGNFVQNRSIWVETSIPGEEHMVGTNAQGVAMLTYGPKSSIGVVWINASAVDNSSVRNSTQVWFVSQEPKDMMLTANPQTMPSHDVDAGFSSQIIAKLVDINGNPDPNRLISFTMGEAVYDKGNHTSDPSLSATSSITNEYGNAIIEFIPGGFETNSLNPSYDPAATGRCNITATWGAISQTVPVIWKNYPYLSAETYTNKKIIAVNETIDVTIMLKADGWALQPKPVDAVLVTDVSGSMNSESKLVNTKIALKNFVGMANNRTFIGLVSYGNSPPTGSYASADTIALWNAQVANASLYPFNPYGSFWDRCLVNPANWNSYGGGYQNIRPDAKLDKTFTLDKNSLNTTINAYTAVGGTDVAAGINGALQMLHTNGVPARKQVIIIMSDGIATMAPITPTSLKSYWPMDWFKRADGEDESITAINAALDAASRAKSEGIEVFTIGFGVKADTYNLSLMASPGDYYFAPNGSELNKIYAQIAGRITTEAGVNTTSNLPYDHVEINSILQDNTGGNPKLNYIYALNYSTWVDMNNITGGRPAHTPAYPYSFDQSSEWNTARKLSFNIGTIYLNQEWVGKYRLRVNESGNINIIGPNSMISFNDGKTLVLPKAYITAIVNLSQTNITTNILEYTNVSEVSGGSGPESELFRTFNISSIYTGVQNVTEQYYIVTYDGRRWFVGSRVLSPEEAAQTRQFRIRVVDLPAGWRYLDPVANVFDAPGPARIPLAPISQAQMDPNKTYIVLK